jgi:alkyl hydroperoxide reductase subunit F
MNKIYDLAILGGGPAGAATAVYAARKRLKAVIITPSWGGQSIDSAGIENWIGTVKISGMDLAKSLENHVRAYAENIIDIKDGEHVTKVEKDRDIFTVTTDSSTYKAKTVLVATGSHRRKLDAPGADKFEHKGLTYCATCDGPMFADQDVVVIGGGNAAFESVAQLLAYCKTVTLIQRGLEYRADPSTVEKILSNPKVKAFNNTEIIEVKGDKFVSSIVFKKKDSGEIIDLPTTGIFVEIGAVPTTEYVKDLVDMTSVGYVKVDPRNQQTSCKGVWSAGDCTDGLYHQNNIAVGDAVKALEDIYQYLHTK